MKVWKPLTEFLKPRDETAFHADFALEEGDSVHLLFGPVVYGMELNRVCPDGKVWKCHFELAVEEFDAEPD